MTKVWFDILTRGDARALKKWWTAHTPDYYRIERSNTNPRFWALIQEKRAA